MTDEQAAAEQQSEATDRPCSKCETPMAVEANFDSAMWVCPQCGHMEPFSPQVPAFDTGSLKRSDHVAK